MSVLAGLPLTVETGPRWVIAARANLRALLADHAHCEQKAASMALALIGRFPDHPGLAQAMLTLAYEELSHFRQVLERIEARGETLTRPLPARYVRALREWAFRHKGGIGALGDLLLVSAFVEARSCERFRLLSQSFAEEPDMEIRKLGQFYGTLAAAESRHWERFRDLALAADAPKDVERRLEAMAQAEGSIVQSLPVEPRMH